MGWTMPAEAHLELVLTRPSKDLKQIKQFSGSGFNPNLKAQNHPQKAGRVGYNFLISIDENKRIRRF